MQNIVETRLMPPMTADVIEYDGSNAHERVAEEIYKLNLMVDGERQRQKELDAEYLLTLEKKKEAKKHIWDLEILASVWFPVSVELRKGEKEMSITQEVSF